MKLIRKILWLLFCLFLALVLIGIGYYLAVTKEVALHPEKLVFQENNLRLVDSNGEQIRVGTDSILRQTTSIRDIPEYTKRAFIDTEDKRFYQHGGYDYKRILRAAVNNLKSQSFKEGASTISQQLIKNTHLTQEKTLKRKLQEWKLTRLLEKKYSKDEILEKYLNTIYFGHSCFGIASASEFYFGKSPNELSLADSAILAGLIKSPNNYSPFRHAENCQRRKACVLRAMQRNGTIGEAERKQALNTDIPTAKTNTNTHGYLHFLFDELSVLSDKYDFNIGGNIEIFSYLNPSIQKGLEEIAKDCLECDKTLLILDGQTHGFKGCVSSIHTTPRLPGSLIKPLLVYAPALQENLLSPATPILDAKIDYGGYSPDNYDKQFHGYISMRECVEKSLNVPAVKVLQSLSVEKGAEYLNRLGLTVKQEDKSLALALGGMQQGYSLRDIVAAYSTFQNNGCMHDCSFISKINVNGITVYKHKPTSRRVFDEESSWLMTNVLQSTAQNGTAKKLRTLPFDIAAKTGTVGTSEGNTDAYAISYTTRDCVGVWLGNADNTKIQHTGGGLPCSMLLKINTLLCEEYSKQKENILPFPTASNVSLVDLDKKEYYDSHSLCLADESAPAQYRFSEWFKNSAIPLNKSTSFSTPTIPPPILQLDKNRVIITLDKKSPTYYDYKVERYDYVTHTTLYFGEYTDCIIDDTLQEKKKYLYTVTPICNGKEGKKITLPLVSTSTGNPPRIEKDEILSKEWWEY